MAGLKMNVEFPTRLCEVKGELGYFHLWEQWSNVVDASLLRGGHPAGQIGQVYGIVEFKDGVRRVDPVSIKFCDEENAALCTLVKHNEALRNIKPKEESTMQNNPRKQDIIQELRDKRQDVTELCTEAEAVNEPHTGSGIVTDCLYLNVRKLPDINADVAVVIDALTRVCVDLDASTEDFYKVRTSDGVEGFCMRKYIALSK